MKASAFSAVAAGFLFFQLGYGFETGDQLQYLLLPYREIYPHFLPGDWFTWSTSHYHVTYAWLVRALHALSGEAGFPYAMLLAQLAVLAALALGILRLAQALEFGTAAAIITLLVLGCVREAGIAGATLNHGRMLPADLALPPFLFACAAWARGARPWVVGAWLGLAGFFHANFAVLGPLTLGPLLALEQVRARRTRSLLDVAATAAAFALIASPSLVLIAHSFLSGDKAPGEVAITLFVRAPHHYDLRAIDIADFCWPILLWLAGLPSWVSLRARAVPRRMHLLAATFGIGVVVGVLGAGLHSVALARLFAWRMSVPMLVLLLLAFGETARDLWRTREKRSVAWLAWFVGCAAWIAVFARQDLSRVVDHLPERALWPIAVGILALLAPFGARGARHALVGVAAAASLVLAAAAARPPLTELSSGRGTKPEYARGLRVLDGKILIGRPKRDLLARLQASTNADARLLIPPGLIEARMLARRTVFVDWKCAPMKGDEALEWKRRMLAAMGVREFPARGYQLRSESSRLYLARPIHELVALARREGMTHVLAETRRQGRLPAGVRRVLGTKLYTLYSVAP